VKGVAIEVASNFNFLGSVMNGERDCADEVERKIVLGEKAMAGGQNKIWKLD